MKRFIALAAFAFAAVSCGDSWKNDWPMEGRMEYPLLFDRNHDMKPFLNEYLN